ncbi:hypothetical protein QQX98_007573 [Neonectria punicea]|uniref:Tyrosine specific protein phosphatases domain-containing protein n=1 Tax=Neonectria punicea TaxID=979145 RepID=A0ABR1GXK8_9HYPO
MADLGPPFIPVAGLPNFRDIGGTPIAARSGHTIKPGIVFRSAEPSRVTDAGITVLQRLRIARVYDLRSTSEVAKYSTGVREWPGAVRVFTPVFLDEDYGPVEIGIRLSYYSGEGTEGYVKTYRSIWESVGPMRTILLHLAEPSPEPLLLHCTAGKDRTGVIVAVILSLCGVDDETIAHEYSLTNAGLGERKDEIMARLMEHESLRNNPEGAKRLLSATPANMLAAMKALQSDYGSVEQYVKTKCGLSPDEIEQIRKNLIVADQAS